MEINSFEIFTFFLCSTLFGMLLSLWGMASIIKDREVSLIVTLYAVVLFATLVQTSSKHSVTKLLARHTTEIQDKQVADIKEAHRRHVLTLKGDHQTQIHLLQGSINTANAKFDRLHHDYDWMSNMYRDQMRSAQEQEDRIAYLEMKIQESGQLTPNARAPFSAPPSRVQFSNPPRRDRFNPAMKSPALLSPLKQVVEAEEL
ncbi:hypothetical protein BKA66DRAFT_444696 [Pyrenochaeta sp. MPI-SDFR-AT-0127]|nr:hypothetical protein BKA66DRAFT_444696 [Pyrenochaeta sp. MPI-SDFR-AT-0127]